MCLIWMDQVVLNMERRLIMPVLEMKHHWKLAYVISMRVKRSNAIKYSDGDLNITLMEDGRILFCNHARQIDEVKVGRGALWITR